MEPGSSSGGGDLLQVPHLDAERVKQLRKGSRKASDLSSFVALPGEERRGSLQSAGLGEQELLDVEEFCKSVPRLSIAEAKVFVSGEDNICQDDIATLQVKLVRQNLGPGEAAGAAHAPLFASAAAVPE